MEGRACRFHFGPLVLAALVGGAVLHHFARCAHPMRQEWRQRHSHFARAWRKYHAGYPDWASYAPQADKSQEKPEEDAA